MGDRLLLPHEVVIEVFQRGRVALVFADVLAVDVGGAAVDDGLLLCADLVRAHELFTQAHDKLAFQHQRIASVAVLLGDVQRVDIAAVGGGDGDDLAAQGADQRAILPLRVYHNNVVVGIQPHEADLLLGHHGLATAGHAHIKAVTVEHRVAVTDDEVAGHGVDAVVQAARVHDLLRLEGQQHGGTFGGQRSHSVDTPQAVGQHRVQRVLLLVLHSGELATVGTANGGQRLRVLLQLLLVVGKMGQRHQRVHHPLVTGGEIVQKLPCFLPHLLQIVGDVGREIVVVVLSLLPAGNVALHRHNAPVHLRHSLVCGHRHDVDRQHHVPGVVHQLGDHGVLDEAGILPQEQSAAHTLVHGVVVVEELQRFRRDGVAEVVAAPLGGLQVEGEGRFLSHAEEVMEQPQALVEGDFPYAGIHAAQASGQVGSHAGEEGASLLDTVLGNGHGDVLLLHQIVAAAGLVQQNVVVLAAHVVAAILPVGHQEVSAELLPVELAVHQRQFDVRVDGQAVENAAVAQKQLHLLFRRGHGIIDVKKAPGLGKPAAYTKDTVFIDALDGDGLLHTAWDVKGVPFRAAALE